MPERQLGRHCNVVNWTTNDEMRRLCPDVPDMDDLFQTPEHAISRTCDTMNIITPSGKSLSYNFEV
ncbi:MAG: hypothetical protein CM15mP8_4790 [Methanobacteriota archaeon]|nr:MAG: hypothetical protein CM15mP8_4790 [Euryarchaeota archaeon]